MASTSTIFTVVLSLGTLGPINMVNALEGQEVQGFEDVFIGNRPVAQPVQRANTATAQQGAATQDAATPDTPETNTGG